VQEASQYLDNAQFLLNKGDKRHQVYGQIGTRAATLKQLVTKGYLNFNRRRSECGCVC
jgi:hypothetical protein